MPHQQYCVYCARVAHRCECSKTGSKLQQFMAHNPAWTAYAPSRRDTPYKRGVPPQIKRRERNTMKRIYNDAYVTLVERYGEACMNCGAGENLVVDHIVAIAKGGLSDIENLQLLCTICNNLKGKLCIDCRP